VEFCLLHHGVLRGKFRWNLQLHLPPRVEFTLCFLAGNTTKCSSKPVVFPYFTTRKYHPSGILGTTRWCVRKWRRLSWLLSPQRTVGHRLSPIQTIPVR
jgi:hypothetical protein